MRSDRGLGLGVLAAAVVALACLCPAAATSAPLTTSADSLRTGWYPDQPQLTPQLLEDGDFGPSFDTPVQGQVYAQPLVFGDTVFVATEENWIYGIDRESGAVLWERNVGVPWDPADLSCGDLVPHVGITGTPVIDGATGIAYFLAKSYASGTSGPAVWEMHAVDVETGAEEPNFPVSIEGAAENSTFEPTHHLQRPGLLLMDGVVYAGFGSHCDNLPYQGWIVGVSTGGEIESMWVAASEGGAVWQSGGGLASDGAGQILFSTGNSFGPQPSPSPTPFDDLGEAVVRLGVQPGGGLEATDFFEPWDREALDDADLDLGSGAPLALPSQYFGTPSTPDLLIEGGKKPLLYLLDRDHLGGFAQGPGGKNDLVQEVPLTHGVFGSPSVWPGDGGYVYLPTLGSLEILEYSVNPSGEPRLSLVAESPAQSHRFGSGSPTVTSDGTTPGSAIVWITSRCTKPVECGASTLKAYAALPSGNTARLLWSGDIGTPTKFARPAAGDGRIYLGTDGHLLAFGSTLPPPPIPPEPTPSPPPGGGTAGPPAPPSPESPAGITRGRPETKIVAATISKRKGAAGFRFSGTDADRFQCRLSRPGGARGLEAKSSFAGCRSPKRYRHLGPGNYRFEVRALNSSGFDPSPARRRFTI